MIERIHSPFFIISLISWIVILAISVNISPYLLGPGPYPPDWRWTYQFSSTLERIWFPAIVIIIILALAYKTEKTNESKIKKNQRLILSALIFLAFLLQISLLFYSRAGLGVMIHRIINPLISGYFSVSLDVQNILQFLALSRLIPMLL
ncbi:MAG: hypothetical protein HY426_01570 [Candidatus Levybacteria bacterium]|nr:hypothetical protein [Candidatus Levybacteria bacterium]